MNNIVHDQIHHAATIICNDITARKPAHLQNIITDFLLLSHYQL